VTAAPVPATTVVFALVGVTGALAAVVGLFAWRARPRPGATWLSLLMAAVLWLLVCRGGLYLSTTDAARGAWITVEWVGTGFIPAFWLLFALAYTGHERYLRPPVAGGIVAVAALTVVVALTNSSHGLLRASFETVSVGGLTTVSSVRGPWFWVYAAFAYTAAVLCLALFVHNAATAARPYREQASLMTVAAVVPLLASLPSALGVTAFDPTPLGFAVTGAVALVAMGQYRFMDAVPVPHHVARDAVLERMESPVVVVDEQDRVVDHNPAADRVFDLDSESVATGEAVVPEYGAILAGDTRTVTAGEGKERTVFDVEVSPLGESGHWTRGHVLVFTDVTERQRHLQRLSVFNRVLRHNIRNEMNLVAGYADLVETEGRPIQVVQERSRRVLELSRKARDTERILEQAEEGARPRSVDGVVHRAVSRVRDAVGESRVDVDVGDPNAGCDELFEPVLVELIENAVLHGARGGEDAESTGTARAESESPQVADGTGDGRSPASADGAGEGGRVEVGARLEGEKVVFRVADDGPGVPDHELAALDTDAETALEHGSGFGLWLVVWGVDALGGSVSFDRPADGGTVVTVTAPALDVDPESDLPAT
jgi:signal transduction histidine kinase